MKFDEKTRKLTPESGMWLTEKHPAEEMQRNFSQLMFLGINDTPQNYEEWTESQKEEWEREHNPEPEEPEEPQG